MIEAFEGSCGICGYSRCKATLDFHHLDPAQKDFTLGGLRANGGNWASIVSELRKCVMLCHNCHMEVHYIGVLVPASAPRFDESFSTYVHPRQVRFSVPCEVCGNPTSVEAEKYCSNACKGTRQCRADYANLAEMFNTGRPVTSIAKELGVSDVAIHKQLRKLGLSCKARRERKKKQTKI